MADSFMGEIRAFPWNYAPYEWALCDGARMPINQFGALYSLLGNYYGGDLQTYFLLPDLRDRAAMAKGQGPNLTNRVLGKSVGDAAITLDQSQIPQHNHTISLQLQGPPFANMVAPPTEGNYLTHLVKPGTTAMVPLMYSKVTTPNAAMNAQTFGPAGGGGAHENRQPYLALTFCISLNGEYPMPADG